MTICFVSREFIGSKRAGGIATYVYDMAKSIVANGHSVIVLTASDDVFSEDSYMVEGIKVIKLSGADFFLHPNRYIQALFSRLRKRFFYDPYRRKISRVLEKLINEEKINIIEFPEYGEEAKFWLKRNEKIIPTVIRFHGIAETKGSKTFINIKNRKIRELLITASKADNISFPSYAMLNSIIDADDFRQNVFRRFQFQIRIVPNPTLFPTQIKRNTYVEGRFIFTAGSFCKGKGFIELIEAVKLLNEKEPTCKLVIAGKLGKLGVYYKKISKNHNSYKNWLTVLGPLDRKELFSYYAHADLCCFPSYWESFGLTCTEAMSVGGLVLGSSSGGMSEIITEGKDGFLIEPKDIQSLRIKVEEILKMDFETKQKIRLSAKEKIRNNFSKNAVVPEMITFYKTVIREFQKQK